MYKQPFIEEGFQIEKKIEHQVANPIKLTIICKHSLIKERIAGMAENSKMMKLIKSFPSLEKFKESKNLPEIDIALICATCCIQESDQIPYFFYEFYKTLPMAKPILINENFSEKDKIDLLKLGIKGFFSIDMDSHQLQKALKSVHNGEIWTNRRLLNLAVHNVSEYLNKMLAGKSNTYELSPRELDILKLMTLGLKNKEIADKLFISEFTVKSHINRILKKLQVNNRTRAIRLALDHHIF